MKLSIKTGVERVKNINFSEGRREHRRRLEKLLRKKSLSAEDRKKYEDELKDFI